MTLFVTWRFYIQKARHFSKSKTTLYVTWFFMKILKLEFIYKKHDTFCYVTFFYTKNQTLRKNQDNFRYVFKYKKLDTLRYAIFHGILKLAEGGGIFICKIITLRFIFIRKNDGLCVTFLHTKIPTLCVTFLYLKKKHFALRFICNFFRIVLISNYKRTYGQSDQIENKFDLFIDNWSYSYDK